MGFVQRRVVKMVIRVVSFPKLTLALVALLAAVAFAWFGLKLSTDQDELLAPKLPYFRDYKKFTQQFPENESFVVILEPVDYVHPPAARRWIELADRISAGLMTLKGEVKRVESHVPPEELGEMGLAFEPEWDKVKAASGQAREFSQLAKVLGEAPGVESLFLGSNVMVRFFTAVSRDTPERSKDLVAVVARSLAAALRAPPESWQRNREIPNLAAADPAAATDPRLYGYNMVADQTKRRTGAKNDQILVINVYAQRDYSSLADVTEPLARMRAVVAGVATDFPEFKHPVITGRPALEADEMATSDGDTRIAEILGLSLIFVVLLLFLRNLWLVIVAELCLGVGIGWTFGWATLSVGRLNLLSLVFVIALIGIGMDYLIQILTRYRFEKRRYQRPQAIWARVFRYVSPPISTACFGAAGAFLVSLLTDFQGAAELGLIAGGGLLLCLLAGYTLLPALLTVIPARVGSVPEGRRYRFHLPHPRAGGLRLLPALLWIAIAVGGTWAAFPPRFDGNLLRLQADHLASVREVRKLPIWYAVITAEDLPTLRQARQAFVINNPGAVGAAETTIGRIESIVDVEEKQAWLAAQNASVVNVKWREPPAASLADMQAIATAAEALQSKWAGAGGAEMQPARAALADLIAALRNTPPDSPMKLQRLSAWQRTFILELKTNLLQFAPAPVDWARPQSWQNVPHSLRDHLVSMSPDASKMAPDRLTFALYVYPKPEQDLWHPGELEKFVREVETRFATVPQDAAHPVKLTGIAPQLYHSTQSIHDAFKMSTLYALGLIFLLVLLDLRNLVETLLAMSVLALGLPMLLLMMHLWQTFPFGGSTLEQLTGIPGTWNFANFFGLPILIGAGHEYGVFLIHRYREVLHDPRRVWRTWDVSDRALLLCGIVTSASFGFLLMARHHGLQSLGWVMAVGTACIYLSSLLVLRPILVWRLKHKGVYHQNMPEK